MVSTSATFDRLPSPYPHSTLLALTTFSLRVYLQRHRQKDRRGRKKERKKKLRDTTLNVNTFYFIFALHILPFILYYLIQTLSHFSPHHTPSSKWRYMHMHLSNSHVTIVQTLSFNREKPFCHVGGHVHRITEVLLVHSFHQHFILLLLLHFLLKMDPVPDF
jgi:hypothetical protein